jgi:hypothetical protein
MAVYVKKETPGKYPALNDYVLFADASASLDGPELTTANHGPINCEPGSRAFCLNGDLYILSTADVWTQVAGIKITSF